MGRWERDIRHPSDELQSGGPERPRGASRRRPLRGNGCNHQRPVGNRAWGQIGSSYRYTDEYFRRARIIRKMGPIDGATEDPILLAMGFLFAHDEVETAIVGTHNPAHLRANIEMVDNDLPISYEAVEELYRRFDAVGSDWPGIL